MKKLSLMFMMFFLTIGITMAQRTISGTITDDLGEALIGANVMVKGTTVGTITDIDGSYSLIVPEGSETIVISYTGYSNKEMAIGDSNTLDISLAEGVMLDEAIVTALGIERDKKSLGYAAQEISGDEVTRVKDANFINSLSGKVAGVNIQRSQNMGGSSNVIIRGYTSIQGNNQALFVVDGTPINNDISNTDDQQRGRGGYDYGNAAMDINPEDIEDVTVLRGAAATALYGSRAANGVILITTKKGKKGKCFGVTLSSGFTAGKIDKTTMPTYQKEYGPGYSAFRGWYQSGDGFDLYDFGNGDGEQLALAVYEDASYGGKLDPSKQAYDWTAWHPELPGYGKLRNMYASDNDATTFYETATTFNNSIAFEAGNDDGGYRLSYTNFDQKGIVPGSKIKKNTIAFGGNYNLTDNLEAFSSINFVNTNGKGRYGTGYDNRNVNQSFRQWYTTYIDFEEVKSAYETTGRNLSWNPYGTGNLSIPATPHYFDNYYWNVANNFSTDERNRIMGNVGVKYQINDWLDVMGKVSMDRFGEIQEERIAIGSVDVSEYMRYNKDYSEMNYDLLFGANKYFGADNIFNFSGNLGANIRRNSFSDIRSTTNGGLVVPGIFSLSNSISSIEAPEEEAYKFGTNSVFARASIGYDNFLYLDLTGRQDVSSTLPVDNNTYFYPSASLSFVFSEFLSSDVFSFGKVRFNYAEVGNDALPLLINNTFDFVTPFNGVPLASANSTLKNPDLKPERTKSIEAGLEMNFLNNRAGFDFTVYQSNSFDQILDIPVSGSTGSLRKVVNAGEIENKGIELSLNLHPVKTANFNWNMNINWAKNTSKVISLLDDADNIQLGTMQGGVSINATVGQPFGTIWGTSYQIHEGSGEPIVIPHGVYGGKKFAKGEIKTIGNIMPDWTGGVYNTLSYKDLSLGFLIDFRKGGDFFSLDTWYGYATGIYEQSAGLNDKGNEVRSLVEEGGGLPIGGVVAATDANGDYIFDEDGNYTSDGTVNTEYGWAGDVFSSFGYARGVNENHVYDGSFVKLRELSLTYALPSRLFDNNFICGADLSLIGRNLWIIHKNSPHTDPEAALSAGRLIGNQSGAYPAVKEYGVNLRVKF